MISYEYLSFIILNIESVNISYIFGKIYAIFYYNYEFNISEYLLSIVIVKLDDSYLLVFKTFIDNLKLFEETRCGKKRGKKKVKLN